jgi:hypothetical protein
MAHTRPVAHYGAALWLTHVAPSIAAKVEVEQNRAAKTITGLPHLTATSTLLTEAQLQPLSQRAACLAAREFGRLVRLPTYDPALLCARLQTAPRLRNRDSSEGVFNDGYRRCWRRTALKLSEVAGIQDLPTESVLMAPSCAPWEIGEQRATFNSTLLGATLASLPPADAILSTDGSAV